MPLSRQQFAASRIMVMAAPNGARRTQKDHPALPLSAEELAECAAALRDAGVSVLHLHVRDRDGRHTLDAEAYREAIARIRRKTGNDLILQITTEAIGRFTREQQMSVVRELRPEAVSLALRELCPDEDTQAEASEFFAWLVDEGIWPQYILYDAADVQRFDALRRRGLFAEECPSCLLVLGRYAEQQIGDPAELATLRSAADIGCSAWAVCCFGPRELDSMLAAHAAGGHVRIGFENNLLLADGSAAGDNAALIEQFTAAIAGSPRQPASANDVRDALIPGGA